MKYNKIQSIAIIYGKKHLVEELKEDLEIAKKQTGEQGLKIIL